MQTQIAPDAALERNRSTYARFITILNAREFDRLPEVVHPDRYREDCVGFTPGRVDLAAAIASLQRVLVGIPDLRAEILDVAGEGDRVYARLVASGTNTGPLFGVPPTGGAYSVSMFDYVRLDATGKIVERVQQSDALGQFRQMYGGTARKAAILTAAGITAVVAAVAGRRRRRA